MIGVGLPVRPDRRHRFYDPTRMLFYRNNRYDDAYEIVMPIVQAALPRILALLGSGAFGAAGYGAYKAYKWGEEVVDAAEKLESKSFYND